MAVYTYEIDLFSYWLQADKDGQSMVYDTVVLKDHDMPIVTGKAIKGLLRDAAGVLVQLKMIDEAFVTAAFGNSKKEGWLKPSSAFSQETIHDDYKHLLYHQIAFVTLDCDKQAVEKQLRTMEVSCPLSLRGTIDDPTDFLKTHDRGFKIIQQCAQLIKELGYKRHRGFGRCQIKILAHEA